MRSNLTYFNLIYFEYCEFNLDIIISNYILNFLIRFDREGYDLEYDIEEKGPAQFLCKISLPVDSINGGPTVAEALVKGLLVFLI